MATGQARPVGRDDLERAVRAIAEHFDTNEVYVIGSQALLVARPDVERAIRMSQEFDIYPGNAKDWEASQPERIEASEEINAHFGEGSQFHQTHGFFIDGVDENTAKLPDGWLFRSKKLEVDLGDGRVAQAVAPEPADLIASKLARGDPKDVQFASICLRQGLAKHSEIKERLEIIMPAEMLTTAIRRLNQATQNQAAAGRNQGFGI